MLLLSMAIRSYDRDNKLIQELLGSPYQDFGHGIKDIGLCIWDKFEFVFFASSPLGLLPLLLI